MSMYIMKPWYAAKGKVSFDTTTQSGILYFDLTNRTKSDPFLQSYKSISISKSEVRLSGTYSYTITQPKIELSNIQTTGQIFTRYSSNLTTMGFKGTSGDATTSYYSGFSTTEWNYSIHHSSVDYQNNKNYGKVSFYATGTLEDEQLRFVPNNSEVSSCNILFSRFETQYSGSLYKASIGYYELTDPYKLTLLALNKIGYGNNFKTTTRTGIRSVTTQTLSKMTGTLYRATLSQA